MNFLLKKVVGTFISVIDSDDEYLKNHLQTAVKNLSKHKKDFYYSGYLNVLETKKIYIKRIPPINISEFDLLTFCPIGHSTVVFKKGFIQRYKPYKYRHDLATWSKIIQNKKKIFINQKITVIRNIHNSNFTKNKIKLIPFYFKIFKNCYKKNYLEILYLFIAMIGRHLINRLRTISIII